MDNSRIHQFSFSQSGDYWIENPVDLLYLTGLSLSKGSLWLSKRGAKLFVDGRYLEKAKKEAPCEVILSAPNALEKELAESSRIGFDSSWVTYERYTGLKKQFPQIDWVPVSNPLKQPRALKDAKELRFLRRAAEITWEGYCHLLPLLKEGVTESELALEFEFFCRRKGASGLSFEPIVAFGENSAYPHHRAGKTTLKNNQIVLIDVGAIFENYRGDMTRVVFFGKPDPELVRLEQIVRKAQQKVLAAIRPGMRLGSLDEIARAEFSKEGLEPLFTHSLGHGIGLETHEFPRIKADGEDRDVILQPGMVFTVEPGLYQVGLGGIRLEDTVVVTEKGCENFFVFERLSSHG
jgi:Xaa-Pro aminopeptidase